LDPVPFRTGEWSFGAPRIGEVIYPPAPMLQRRMREVSEAPWRKQRGLTDRPGGPDGPKCSRTVNIPSHGCSNLHNTPMVHRSLR
jgi:hypothetical protein